MEQHRRRLDNLLSPDFVEGLADLPLDELRHRREMANDTETELSFYRRLLHGRMDLLNFELARRRGDEKRSLIEALPEILAAGETAGGNLGRVRGEFSPDLPDDRRRPIDDILEDDFLTRISDLTDQDLADIHIALTETEAEISSNRRKVQDVFDVLHAQITGRYRQDLEDELAQP